MLRYERSHADSRLTMLLNLGPRECAQSLDAGEVLLSTYLDRAGERVDGTISLRPAEGVVIARSGNRLGTAPCR